MEQYVVVDELEGRTWSTYGPFRSRREAQEWKDKTMEQVLGIIGSSRKVKGTLRVLPLTSRNEVQKELAVEETRSWRGERTSGPRCHLCDTPLIVWMGWWACPNPECSEHGRRTPWGREVVGVRKTPGERSMDRLVPVVELLDNEKAANEIFDRMSISAPYVVVNPPEKTLIRSDI